MWDNINDLPYAYDGLHNANKYVDDEAEEDLEDASLYSDGALDDGDDLDGFIDDETQDSDRTDGDDTDDEF